MRIRDAECDHNLETSRKSAWVSSISHGMRQGGFERLPTQFEAAPPPPLPRICFPCPKCPIITGTKVAWWRHLASQHETFHPAVMHAQGTVCRA
eukprot:2310797-Karenia_brevis.AAC.1